MTINRLMLFLFCWGGLLSAAPVLDSNREEESLDRRQLEQSRQEKVLQKQETQKKRDRVAGKERRVLTRLQEIETELDTLQAELNRYKAEMAEEEKKQERSQAEFQALKTRYLDYQQRATKRVIAIYKMGYRSTVTNQHQLVGMLMQSEGLIDLLTKYKYANFIAKSDQQLLADLVAQQDQIKAVHAELQQHLASIEASKQMAQVKRRQLLARRKDRQRLLEEYRTQRSTYDQVLKELRQSVAELEEVLGIVSTDTLTVKAERLKGISKQKQGKLPWPVTGKIVKNQNPFDRGITIKPTSATTEGQKADVRSIANGVVARVIDSVVGYGNTILILHGSAYTSVYTHLSVVSVDVGDEVKVNQIIGQVGDSGSLIGQVLYFELWHNYARLDTHQWLKH